MLQFPKKQMCPFPNDCISLPTQERFAHQQHGCFPTNILLHHKNVSLIHKQCFPFPHACPFPIWKCSPYPHECFLPCHNTDIFLHDMDVSLPDINFPFTYTSPLHYTSLPYQPHVCSPPSWE